MKEAFEASGLQEGVGDHPVDHCVKHYEFRNLRFIAEECFTISL